MNQKLWNAIEDFDFDVPLSEFNFSTRLAKENFWTEAFTHQAILEYKKFMYLAATSDSMVSPSEIVDQVWHEHLVFTKSYQEFCELLGKQIQHIPSTHHKGELQKFKQAKEDTQVLYNKVFGEQPRNIWDKSDMFQGLNLKKACIKLRMKLLATIFILIALFFPLYYLLKPIYIQIQSKPFLIGMITIGIILFVSLEIYNRHKLKDLMNGFDANSFFFDLEPDELMYLKTRKLPFSIYATLHELVEDGIIKIDKDKKVSLLKDRKTDNKKYFQVTSILKEKDIDFQNLISLLSSKPIFNNINNSMDAFVKYVQKSSRFHQLFYLNFIVLSFYLLLAFVRLAIGIAREKPILYIIGLTFVLLIYVAYHLSRLAQQLFGETILSYYKDEVLPLKIDNKGWKWNYYLMGPAVLAAAFLPILPTRFQNDGGGSAGCGSNCGSSCGSSCGGGCGGCGS
ncbi:hypothetical protein [Moheibacter sediminis]|uniref:TIGR04222 domain-containing protein n=1 Tax=Moheibacter sediminis TaxID=1434700 RepID=A0A1W2C9H0_9FLAO|nr:hypothetical protein [Moheibacter sediminis]SMC81338.1 hypothetical protein SAMN06296427_10970 [Moheibacter sediminis]